MDSIWACLPSCLRLNPLRADWLVRLEKSRHGLFLCHLGESLQACIALQERHPTDRAIRTNLFAMTLVAIAAKKRWVNDEDARVIGRELSAYDAHTIFWLAHLDLFESVARLARTLQADTPPELRDALMAWGRHFLRGAAEQTDFSSKRDIIRNLRAIAKELGQGENPFDGSYPELYEAIRWGRMLSHQSPETQRLRPMIRKEMRAVRVALEALPRAYSQFATCLSETHVGVSLSTNTTTP